MIRKIGLTALVCASLTPATAQADTFETVPRNGLTRTKHGLGAGAHARLDPRRNLKFVLEHPRSNRVYSLTEKDGDRIVFAIDGASVGLAP